MYKGIYGYVGFRVSPNFGVPFVGSPSEGLEYIGVYIGVPLFWETTVFSTNTLHCRSSTSLSNSCSPSQLSFVLPLHTINYNYVPASMST